MVGVVVGSRLGLEQTSGYVLGSRGQLGSSSMGRAGENVFVNAATGNLILSNRDEFLVGLGINSAISRTYNSQGQMDGDNNDGWRIGASRRVSSPTGTLNTVDSTVTRTDWDGSQVVYTWDAARSAYLATEGAGSYDTLEKVGTEWVWTDGDSRTTETYAAAGSDWRIVSQADTDANTLTFAYTAAGYVSRITTTTADGKIEHTDLSYSNANLTELATTYWDKEAGAYKTLTRTRYAYDASNRLSAVTVDLSPENNLIGDGKTYVTTYTYDGTSTRIASISQTDGSRVDIAYEAGGAYRVTSIVQTVATGVTRSTAFTYVSATRTDVTGPDGLTTSLEYDAEGQLTRITEPAATAGGAAQVREFSYDSYGNVTRIQTSPTTWTIFVYNDTNGDGVPGDHNGLWTRQYQRRAEGSYLAASRTYDARNAVLTETRYLSADPNPFDHLLPDDPLTTRYVYDSENHLRYTISPTGSVVQYDYSTPGNLVRTIAYTEAAYTVAGLATTASVSEAAMIAWAGGLPNPSAAQITETIYDHRGNISRTIAYSTNNVGGGANGGFAATGVNYVYDQAGQLLSRNVTGMNGTETFVYDGMGRLIGSVDFDGGATTTAFHDALGTTVVRLADGLNQISTFNRAGERISYTETERGADIIDATGWPMGEPPPGPAGVPGWPNIPGYAADSRWSWTMVNGPNGRQVVAMETGQIEPGENGGGAYTNASPIRGDRAYEYVFYFRKADLTRHSLYFGMNEQSGGQAYVESASTGVDDPNPYFFTAGPAQQQALLDDDRWYKVVAYVLPQGSSLITAGGLGGVYDAETGVKVADVTNYRWNDTRPDDQAYARFFNYYDETEIGYSTYFLKPEVRQVPTHLFNTATTPSTQYRYDNMGRLRTVIDPTGVRSHALYDRVGRKVADIDGDGSLIEYRYDLADRLVSTTRYATWLTPAQIAGLVDAAGNPTGVELAAVRPTATANDSWAWQVYDDAGRLTRTVDGVGGVVDYRYDGASRLMETRAYSTAAVIGTAATFDATGAVVPSSATGDRVTRRFHDADGRQIGTLDAEGYLTQIHYDRMGRVIQTSAYANLTSGNLRGGGTFEQLKTSAGTHPTDIRTWSVYDGRGFLKASVNGEGEVTLYEHTPLGHIAQIIRGRKLASVPTTQPTLEQLTAAPATVLETTTYTRNHLGQVLTESRALADGPETTTYTYDSLHRLVATFTDRTANANTNASPDYGSRQRYDARGRMIGQLTGRGTAALLALGANPTAAQVDAVYRQWGVNYAYDEAGRLISRTDPDGVNGPGDKTTYFYDADGNLAYQVNPLGETTGYTYDPLNRRTRTITYADRLPDPGALKGGKIPSGFPSRTTPPASASVVAMAYNVSDTVRSMTDAMGVVTAYGYDAFGDTISQTDQRGDFQGALTTRLSSFQYDRRGLNTETIIDVGGLNLKTKASYDAFGRTIKAWDRNNLDREMAYDRAGRIVKTFDVLNKESVYAYDARGNVVSMIDRLNRETTVQYDAFNREVRTLSPAGIETIARYDNGGATLSIRVGGAGGRLTSWTYDADGRLKTTSDAVGNTLTNTYDTAGRIYETTDARGTRVQYAYDAAGRLYTETLDPTGLALKTTYEYDAKGRQVVVTDADGRKTQIDYNKRGERTDITVDVGPGGKALKTSYRFDRAGNTLKVIEAAGVASTERTTQYTYDAGDRLVEKRVGPAGLNIVSAYEYDANGNVVTRVDRINATTTATTRFAYDVENRLTFTVDGSGGVTRTAYDAEGQIIRTIAYANRPDFTAGFIYSDANLAAAVVPVTAHDRDQNTYFAYDKNGRLTFTIDATRRLTRNVYAPSGDLLRTVQFAGTVPGGVPFADADLTALSDQSTFIAGGSRQDRAVYDAAGRQIYAIDARGQVIAYLRDGIGNVTRQIRYATLYAASGQPDAEAMLTWSAANGTDVAVSRAYYDTAGRPELTVDALGHVSRTTYDTAGRVLTQTRYAISVAVTDATTINQLTSLIGTTAQTNAARTQTYSYDTAGRLVQTTDAAGVVTRMVLDALGRQTETHFAYGTADASVTRRDYDNAGRLIREERADGTIEETADVFDYDGLSRLTALTNGAGTAQQTVSRRTYDNAGRMLREDRGATTTTSTDALTATDYTYDGRGLRRSQSQSVGTVGEERLTLWDYDVMGRVVSSKVALTGGVVADTRTTYDAYGNVETVTDPRGNVGRFFHDAVNRLIWQVDPEGYVTRTTYDLTYDDPTSPGLESRETVTRYMVKVSSGWTPASGTPAGTTAVTQVIRDKLDRVIRVIDAENKSELYGLNAFGDRVSLTNRIGGLTSYTHDKRGLVKTETVLITWAGSTTTVVNTFDYDARGNLLTTVEASGRPEARTTRYAYDALNRLNTKTGDAVQVTLFDPATRVWTTTSEAPVETIRYDALGNVTETIAASRARTLFYYDRLGRKTAEVAETGKVTDAVRTGVLRTWSYDAANNPIEFKVYNKAVTLPAQAGGTQPAPAQDDVTFRHTVYGYDRNNRLLSTSMRQVRLGNYIGDNPFYYETLVGDITSRTSYDASGNVTATTDMRGYKTLYFYDKSGRQTAKVDAEGFLTTWQRDAEGNPVVETRYANRMTTAATEGVYPTGLPAADVTNDRITTFTYDLNGRRRTETRLGVVSHSVAANGVMSTGSTTALIQYDYDGLGNVVRKVEANNDAFRYEYDNQGRMIRTIQPDVGPGERRVMTNTYNDLNAVIRVTDGQDGASDSQLRSTVYAYGAGGRLASTAMRTNVAGQAEALFTRNFAYDLGGNLVRESYQIRTDGSDKVFEGRRYDYDAQGRVVLQSAIEVSTTASAPPANAVWTVGDRYSMTYNVHGEVIGKGVNEMTQETFAYDSGGRMWRSNAGDGVTRIYVHDQNGNVTLTIGSAGYDLGNTTIQQALALISTPTGGTPRIDGGSREDVVTTFTAYDARGQLSRTVEPNRRLRAAGGGSTTAETSHVVRARTYNAFGEVSIETDARGGLTLFTYNTMGRLTLQKSPAVVWYDESGTQQGLTTPEERRYYDVSGRLIGTRDANGNLTRRTLQAGSGHNGSAAIVKAEFDAGAHTLITGTYTDYDPTGVTRYDLNVFGDITRITRVVSDATPSLNMAEERNYDLGGRMISLYRSMRVGATGALVEFYTYDGLARRTAHTNSLFNTVNAENPSIAYERTRYDLEGRVAGFSDYEGRVTQYAYQWQAGHTTQGMGQQPFGGWTQTTTHVSGRTQSVDTDYFGREIGKRDLGDHVTERRFDAGGRLVYQIMRLGVGGPVQQHLTFAWHNGGQIAAQRDHVNATLAEYEYDVAGSRTRERYQVGSTTHQDTGVTLHQDSRVTYDALGRMTTLTDTALAGTTTVAWSYDLNGNIRRMKANYPSMLSGGPAGQDFWYKYDTQNRFTLVQGQLIDNQIQLGVGRGVSITYDSLGNRASATRLLAGRTEVEDEFTGERQTADYTYETREDYSYTADGYLYEVRLANAELPSRVHADQAFYAAPATGHLLARDTRDVLGRLTTHEEFSGTGSTAFTFRRLSTYDRASMLTRDQTLDRANDDTQTTTTYSYNDRTTGQWTGVVQAVTTLSTTNSGGNNVPKPTSTLYDYVWYDDARQSLITYDGDTSLTQAGITNALHTSTFHYDGNGRAYLVNIADGTPRNVSFVTDAQGQVLRRTVDRGSGGPPPGTDPWTRYLSFDGMRVGEVTNDGPSGTDYAAGMNAALKAARARGTASGGNVLFQNGRVTAAADFDQAYQNVAPGSVAGAGAVWTVRDGDTLQGIAAAVWGDASLWYLIADQNGLTSASTLIAGQTLTLPAKVANVGNTSDTFRPYDPNKALGDLSPTQVKPPKQGGGGCGGTGQIIAIIIAVAVAAIVAPYAIAAVANIGVAAGTGVSVSAVSGALAAGTAGSLVGSTALIAGGAIAGAAASIASQAFSLATGMQDSFDWKGLALSAISGAVGGGLGAVNSLAGNGFGVGLARGAVNSVITQGIGVATGLQDSFSWTNVAVSAVVSGVSSAVISTLPPAAAAFSAQGIANSLVSGGAGAFAGAATRSVLTGTNFGDNLIAVLPDVIGATIGNAIAGGVQARSAAERERAALAQTIETFESQGMPIRYNEFGEPEAVKLSYQDAKGQTHTVYSAAAFDAVRGQYSAGSSVANVETGLRSNDQRQFFVSTDSANRSAGTYFVTIESTEYIDPVTGAVTIESQDKTDSRNRVARAGALNSTLQYVNEGATHLANFEERHPNLTGMAVAGAQAALGGGLAKNVIVNVVREVVGDRVSDAAANAIQSGVSGILQEHGGIEPTRANLGGMGAAFGAQLLLFGGPRQVLDAAKNIRGAFNNLFRRSPRVDPYITEGAGSLGAAATPKRINLPSWRSIDIDMPHVLSGHTRGGSRVGSGSTRDLFPDGMNNRAIERDIRQAYRNGTQIRSQGDRVLVRGPSSSMNGRSIEMWVNRQTRQIETAYPTD